MKDLMDIFSETKSTINLLELVGEIYNEGNINVIYDAFNPIRVEKNFVYICDLHDVIENIQMIDYLITKDEYDKEVRVYIYKEMLNLKHNFIWAFLFLLGFAKVGISDEELDALIERYKKEFKFDLGETMVEEAFKKQGIKIKW